jgi:plasmid replication initiation protein
MFHILYQFLIEIAVIAVMWLAIILLTFAIMFLYLMGQLISWIYRHYFQEGGKRHEDKNADDAS